MGIHLRRRENTTHVRYNKQKSKIKIININQSTNAQSNTNKSSHCRLQYLKFKVTVGVNDFIISSRNTAV